MLYYISKDEKVKKQKKIIVLDLRGDIVGILWAFHIITLPNINTPLNEIDSHSQSTQRERESGKETCRELLTSIISVCSLFHKY